MCKFPLDPALSRAILQAHEEECLREVVTIAAMLSVESIWFSRRKEKGDRDEEAERAHATFRHPRGDHITYLMVYAAWEERGFSEQWCVRAWVWAGGRASWVSLLLRRPSSLVRPPLTQWHTRTRRTGSRTPF